MKMEAKLMADGKIEELKLLKRRCVEAVRKGQTNLVGVLMDDIHKLQKELKELGAE
jgi:hypothetical protein